MVEVSSLQTNFTAGEISPRLKGRVDVGKYRNGCEILENMLVHTHGGATRRPGTYFAERTKNSNNPSRLIPFVFSTVQAYILEFGDQYVRFYRNGGIIESSPGVPYEVASPYTFADINQIWYVQSADVLYLCHPDLQTRKLSRTGHTSWFFSLYAPIDGPYLDQNVTVATVTSSATTGTTNLTSGPIKTITGAANNGSGAIRITATAHTYTSGMRIHITAVTGTVEANGVWTIQRIDANNFDLIGSTFVNAYISGGTAAPAIWVSTDVGRLMRIKVGANWGYVQISVFTTERAVTAEVIATLGGTTATPDWRLGSWGETMGYPSVATFHEERLWFGRTDSEPSKLWATRSGSFEDMSPSNAAGTVAADDALQYSIATDDVNDIRWLSSGGDLEVGASGAEFNISSSSTTTAITPTDVQAKRQTKRGSASDLRPVRIDDAVLFVQRSRRKIREYSYSFDKDNHVSQDMSILAEHITQFGLFEIDYQQEPDSIVFGVRGDGVMVGMTYQREQDVIGWHRHLLGGNYLGGNAQVESVAVIPNAFDGPDELWMIVRRTILGATQRYVEFMTPQFDESFFQEEAFFVDSGLTYDGPPADMLTGLGHLNGETVSVLVDGAVHPDVVVNGDSIELDYPGSLIHVGLSYKSRLRDLPPEVPAPGGTAQGKMKRVHKINIRFHLTLGAKFGTGDDETQYEVIPFRQGNDPMDSAPPIFSGLKEVLMPSGYEQDPQTTVIQEQPLPMTILQIIKEMQVYG